MLAVEMRLGVTGILHRRSDGGSAIFPGMSALPFRIFSIALFGLEFYTACRNTENGSPVAFNSSKEAP
jgi:hypothetical protein